MTRKIFASSTDSAVGVKNDIFLFRYFFVKNWVSKIKISRFVIVCGADRRLRRKNFKISIMPMHFQDRFFNYVGCQPNYGCGDDSTSHGTVKPHCSQGSAHVFSRSSYYIYNLHIVVLISNYFPI